MLGFITDDNNDLILDDLGMLTTESGLEAYRQHLVNTIRLQQFEYGYDLNRGLNYMGYLFGQKGNIKAWEAQLLELISNTDFVKRIKTWEYNINGNNLEFVLVVETDLGEITIKG